MARRGNYDILAPYTWCVPGAGGILLLLALLLAGALIGNLVVLIMTATMGQQAAMQYGTLVSYPIMFIPPMLWASANSRSRSFVQSGLKLDSNNFAPLGGWKCAALVMLATAACSIFSDAAGVWLPDMPKWLEDTLKNMTTGELWVNFLCVSIFAPFFEEWLCRAMVLRGLLGNGVRPVWAIVISALFFALIHMNPWQAIPAFILGCLFGYVYYKTGSLKLTMLMHFTNNTLALLVGHIDSLQDKDTWIEVFGPAYWYVFAGCVLLLALVILAFRRIPLSARAGNIDPVPSAFGD